MYPNYTTDIRMIKTYEALIKEHGIEYGNKHLSEFHRYNQAKYRLSLQGLINAKPT